MYLMERAQNMNKWNRVDAPTAISRHLQPLSHYLALHVLVCAEVYECMGNYNSIIIIF